MTTITTPPHHGGETRNPYERLLWSLAVVLLVGSVIAIVTAHNIYTDHSSGWTTPLPTDLYVAQLLNLFGPGAFTGGLVLSGMALTTRVLKFDRRAEMANLLALTNPVAADNSHPAVTTSAAPQRPGTASPVDHSLYMRPRSTD